MTFDQWSEMQDAATDENAEWARTVAQSAWDASAQVSGDEYYDRLERKEKDEPRGSDDLPNAG